MNRRKNTAVRKQNFADVSLSPNITPYEKTTKALFKDQFYPAESPDPVPRLCSVSSKSSFSSINLVNDDCSKEGIDGSCNVDKHRTTISSKQDKPILQDENVELKAKLSRFMTKRMMTPLQERMNAVTVVPNSIYCIYFIFSSKWISSYFADAAMQFGPSPTEFNALAMHCFQSNWFPSLHAMPPPTVIAIAFGTCIHAPFSFVYHWKYCTSLDHPFDRVNHISRRLDSAFIHLLCAFYSFGGSGSVGYFLISSIINAFFFAKHFDAKIIPARNQFGMLCGFITYFLPIIYHGGIKVCTISSISALFAMWSFVKYPMGGWSHSLGFHGGLMIFPVIMMKIACTLEPSRDYIQNAAFCAFTHK